MRAPSCESGSVTLETSIALVAICALLTGGFMVLYVTFVRVWMNRESYETAVCLASRAEGRAESRDRGRTDCGRDFRVNVARALPIGRLGRVEMHLSNSNVEIRARFSIGGRDIAEAHEKLRLPLVGKASP